MLMMSSFAAGASAPPPAKVTRFLAISFWASWGVMVAGSGLAGVGFVGEAFNGKMVGRLNVRCAYGFPGRGVDAARPVRLRLPHGGFEKEARHGLSVPVATRLGTHGRWLRLIIAMAIEAMERTGAMEQGKAPVLFCLDEFAALGHMESIEKAATGTLPAA